MKIAPGLPVLPSEYGRVDAGVDFDPVPAGFALASDGAAAAGTPGVVVLGAAGDDVGAPTALHWLAGGAWTLHAPSSCAARAPSTATPSDAAVPPSTMQRHPGLDVSMPDSAEQHDGPSGVVALPDR